MNSVVKTKILIIRFSSFGDIVQCMSTLSAIKNKYPNSEIHWVARSDMASILTLSPLLNKGWHFERKLGLSGLIDLAKVLRAENYTHIYDAHSNIRSRILSLILAPLPFSKHFVRRSKERVKRIFLFNLKINFFPRPFKGMKSYLAPLKSWGIVENSDTDFCQSWQFGALVEKKIERLNLPESFISLVPSAAWEMKRWPLEYWKNLISLCPNKKFVILGGPGDDFCQELEDIDPARVRNLAGETSLIESCAIVEKSDLVVSADTGLIHVADILGVNGLSLIGPTAFGFCTGKHIKTIEIDMKCRPCTKDGRGKCSQDIYQKCLVNITPELIAKEVLRI